MAREPGRTFLVGSPGLPEIVPIPAYLADGPLGHFGWQGSEFRAAFQGVSQPGIMGDGTVSEESLPQNEESAIVEILGCKTGRVDHGKTRILSINDVLLNQLHAYSPELAAG